MITKQINSYTRLVSVDLSKIRKAGIFLTGMKTVKQWYDTQTDKPDIVCNCGFFCWTGRKHEPCYSLKVNGEILTTDSLHRGLGIKNNQFYIDNIQNSSYKDFVSGVPVITENGKNKVTREWVDMLETISGREPRTVLGFNDNSVSVLCIDGRQPGKLGAYLEELPQLCLDNGLTNAVNLDGGYSSMTVVNGEIFNEQNKPRAVHSVLAIWAKGDVEMDDWKAPDWSKVDYKFAQVDRNGVIKAQNNVLLYAKINAKASGYAVWEKDTRTRLYPEVVDKPAEKPTEETQTSEKAFLLDLMKRIEERLGEL